MSINEEYDIKTAEELAEETADITTEEIADTVQIDDIPASEQDELSAVPADKPVSKKKRPFIQVPVIISIIIVALAVLGYFTYVSFFLQEPEGVLWSADYDGTTYYFEFNNDNAFHAYIGSIEMTSTYEKTKGEDADTLTVNTDVADFYAGMPVAYDITGSRILGNQVISLSYGDQYQFELNQAKAREDVLELPESFTPDEELLGDWEFSYYGYPVYRVSFHDDGAMKLDFIQDGICYNGIYTIDDGKINFTYYVNDSVVVPLEYSVDGDTLTFMGFNFTRVVEGATPDQV